MNDLFRVFPLLRQRRRHQRDLSRLGQELAAKEREIVSLRADQLLARKRRARDERQREELDERLELAIEHGQHARAVELSTAATHLTGRAAKRLAEEAALGAQLRDALAERVRIRRDAAQVQVELDDLRASLSDVVWGQRAPALPPKQ